MLAVDLLVQSQWRVVRCFSAVASLSFVGYTVAANCTCRVTFFAAFVF